MEIDINRYKDEAFFYIVPSLALYDIILGLLYMKRNDMKLSLKSAYLFIRLYGCNNHCNNHATVVRS